MSTLGANVPARAIYQNLEKIRKSNAFLQNQVRRLQNENRHLVALANELPDPYRQMFSAWFGDT